MKKKNKDKNLQPRLTMPYVARLLMAEVGESKYWRTVKDLICRPGEMMADYLNGKRKEYLQPFQLLLGILILFGIVLFIVPAEVKHYQPREQMFMEMVQSSNDLTPDTMEVIEVFRKGIHGIDAYVIWNEEHMEFGLLTRSILLIVFCWLLFRRSERDNCPYPIEGKYKYNFAEILTAHIYIICQLQLLSTIWVLVVGWFVPVLDFSPYIFPAFIMWIVLFVDYQQLFRRRWYDTLWRTIVSAMWIL